MAQPAKENTIAVSDMTPTQQFGRLWRGYLRKHLLWIILAFFLMTVEGSTLGLLSYMLQPMFDLVFVEGQTDKTFIVAFAILMLFVVRAVAGVIQRVVLARISMTASTELQVDLLGHTLDLDNGFHSRTSPGVLIERVQGDVLAVQTLWNHIVTGAGRDLIGLITLMIVAISVDWKWALIAVVGAPFLLLPSIAVQRYIRRKSHSMREIAGKRTTRLDEVFHGITPIKLNRMETYQRARFTDLSSDWVRTTVRQAAGQATVPGLVDLAVGVGFFCVLIYGGPQIASGEKTIGQFMSFFTAMSLAFQPLRRLANIASSWEVLQASLSRIFGLMDTKPSVKDTASPTSKTPNGSKIEFKDVTLSYGRQNVLSGLSFTVPEGTTAAFVGQSGAGKSSIFNVLSRLIDAQEGLVEIGGVATKDLKLADLRALFSVVSQDALLFDETLRENILLGRTDVHDTQLQKVLDAANVTEFLKSLPDGLETMVGARGSNLSGGQRQRVAIARALLRDTPILLLDEATSALDAESEKIVQQALDMLSKGRTTLVIAHRLSTIRNADQIIVLDKGTLAESGTHEDLLKKGGAYANLHALQFNATSKPETPQSTRSIEEAPAVAVLPDTDRPRLMLGTTPLDELNWPDGRPQRLNKGTVADMDATDHLIIHANARAFLPRPLLKPSLSVRVSGQDTKNLRLARKHHRKFHRVLTDDTSLAKELPNGRQMNDGDNPATLLNAI